MTGRSRSEQMARIRGKNTAPERRLRRALWAAGLRYRIHLRTPVGRPDLVFTRPRVCVFIDGCFWHGCPAHYVLPRTRQDFWLKKLRDNVARDRMQTATLESLGWIVLRVWEHDVFEQLDAIVERVRVAVRKGDLIPQESWSVERVESVSGVPNMERRFLVSLHEPLRHRIEERIRSTTKWRVPQVD